MSEPKYINPDSDGKFYTVKDMARTNCNDCKGCHACCTDMGDSILLDPYDLWQFATKESMFFAEMMQDGKIALTQENFMLVPYLCMNEQKNTCCFLNEEGRCSVHASRPGICRLFPLGRDFQRGELSYILLQKLCPANKSKIRIEKWIGIVRVNEYQEFLLKWHKFRMTMQQYLKEASSMEQKQMNLYLIKQFYACNYAMQSELEFFDSISDKINKIYEAFGM